MWYHNYQDKLTEWYSLRQQCNTLPLAEQCEAINNWWFRMPMVNRLIEWNTVDFWPDPWELLNNSGYCDLARALGIVYTFKMLENKAWAAIEIAQVDQDNLVLVDHGKYILNWAPGEVLNIRSNPISISRSLDSNKLQSF